MAPSEIRSVDEFVARKVLPQFHDVVGHLRRLMRECVPDAHEVLTYGIFGWRRRNMLAVVSPTKKDVTLAFSLGARFRDEHGLLAGVGKVSKHVKLRDVAGIDDGALRDYIAQAVALDAAVDRYEALLLINASR